LERFEVGRVVYWNDQYGFLRPIEGGDALFFSGEELPGEGADRWWTEVGDVVTFERGATKKGPAAKNVVPIID
jgi:cold shock CspA family protein